MILTQILLHAYVLYASSYPFETSGIVSKITVSLSKANLLAFRSCSKSSCAACDVDTSQALAKSAFNNTFSDRFRFDPYNQIFHSERINYMAIELQQLFPFKWELIPFRERLPRNYQGPPPMIDFRYDNIFIKMQYSDRCDAWQLFVYEDDFKVDLEIEEVFTQLEFHEDGIQFPGYKLLC